MTVAFWKFFYLVSCRNLEVPYDVSELIGIGEYVILLVAIIAIVYQIKAIGRKENRKLNALILLMLILLLSYSTERTIYIAHEFNTGGLFSVADTKEENGTYYLILNLEYDDSMNPMKLECDKETYDSVIVDENVQYLIEFYWNILTPHTGYLVSIDLNDYCDNRQPVQLHGV